MLDLNVENNNVQNDQHVSAVHLSDTHGLIKTVLFVRKILYNWLNQASALIAFIG